MVLISQTPKVRLCRIILTAWIILWVPLSAAAGEDPVNTVRVSGDFEEIRDNVRQAIEGKGINIAHTLPAGDMLNRTGKDFGVEKNILSPNLNDFSAPSCQLSALLVPPKTVYICGLSPWSSGLFGPCID